MRVINEYRSALLKVVTFFEAHTLVFSYFALSSRLESDHELQKQVQHAVSFSPEVEKKK